MELHRVFSVSNRCHVWLVCNRICNRKGVCAMKNKQKQSNNNHSFVIGKSKITLTKKGIQIQSPKVIIQGDVIQERKEK